RKHGYTVAVGIVESLDQVRVAGPAASRTHGKAAGQLGFGGGRKGSRFLVADVNPFDPVRPPDRVAKRVEAVTADAVDARHAGLAQDMDELLTDRAHERLLWLPIRTASSRRKLRARLRPSSSCRPLDEVVLWLFRRIARRCR